MASLALPYFRDANELPGPLPSLGEINESTTDLPTIRDPRYSRIVRIRNLFVVKYGIWVSENEGHALLAFAVHSI